MAFTEYLSPWLMFDYAAPEKFPPTSRRLGVGEHPHRGFETVTIAFQGEVEHRDSVGNGGVIGPGDVQWMTAGRGIIHEEYHSTKFAKNGGTFEMCQLWLNLPAKHKMDPPRYQPILSHDIPEVELPGDAGAKARLIAGSLFDTKGPAQTMTPVELWDVSISEPHKVVEFPIPSGHSVIVFVRRGGIIVGDGDDGFKESKHAQLGPQAVAILGRSANHKENLKSSFQVMASQKDTAIIILGGEPLNEPIAARGPFVMNTHEEIMQANRDYMYGRMGT